MNKHKFSGWKTVFGFTFQQAVSKKGFKVVTALVSILIIATLVAVNILTAIPDEEEKVFPISIQTVYVYDQSGLNPTDFNTMMPQVTPIRFDVTNFIQSTASNRQEVISQAQNTTGSIAVFITKQGTNYQIEASVPAGINEGETKELLDAMANCFTSSKMLQVGLTMEQLNILLTPVNSTVVEVGEDNSIVTVLIKMLAPMLFGLLMYFMLLFYGQTISKEVSTEKTSKLMESLLTSIHPYALITGKILGIAFMAIMQIIIWIASVLVGLYGGNAIAHAMYPDFENSVVTIINFLRDHVGESAMSLPSMIIALLIFCVGFLFYCVIAGLAGSMVSKPEDVASTQSLFVLPVVISWLICYMAPLMEKDAITAVVRYIPFTIPFCTPIDLMTGTISTIEGLVSLGILLVFSILLIMLAARLYKGLVLYTGQKVNIKTIGKIIKAKN